MTYGITATTTNTDNLDYCVLLNTIDEFKHCPYSFVLCPIFPDRFHSIVVYFSRYLRALPAGPPSEMTSKPGFHALNQ
ncbi:hypothetical protein C7H08_12590 [Marinobacter halophilus]|uniref:Uncharacterized protein n=1 Tax=Marinobacter halophilus TaxID=1323740 RepID=A0A2T1KBM8_9GAMM|nr:hypothetical protein C7H08_12590 [Marinobacter halophilus]